MLFNILYVFLATALLFGDQHFCSSTEDVARIGSKRGFVIGDDVSHQVQVLYYGKFTCGGAILSPHWILTAGHCALNFTNCQILAGTDAYLDYYGGQLINAVEIIRHPNFNGTYGANDIALIKLARPVKMSESTKPAAINRTPRIPPGTTVSVTKWSKANQFTQEAQLKRSVFDQFFAVVPQWASVRPKLYKIDMTVTDNWSCVRWWPWLGEDELCASPSNLNTMPCYGDSGSPLTYNGIVVGIVSYGSAVCPADDGRPNVFTRISSHIDWIQQVMAADKGIINGSPSILAI